MQPIFENLDSGSPNAHVAQNETNPNGRRVRGFERYVTNMSTENFEVRIVYSSLATTVNSFNEEIASHCGERKVSVYFSVGWCMLYIFLLGFGQHCALQLI